MINLFEGTQKDTPIEESKVIHKSDLLPGVVTQRAITEGYIIFRGDSSELPDGSSEKQVFYENDTKKLKIWNPTTSSWDEVQFS